MRPHFKILTYCGLDPSPVREAYGRATEAIARGDFRSADVKKLKNLAHGKYYRAKLDYTTRLIFCLVRHQGEVCALMLEIINNHDYSKSRFVRGGAPDEVLIEAEPDGAAAEAEPLRYVNPERPILHFLDKPISFDHAQAQVFEAPLPLILVGSAGSGKTALTLEKLKLTEGEVLYVTQSAYLAGSARDLYYGSGFARERQEATFLSYREFLDSIQVPAGREATWADFCGWFARMHATSEGKGLEAHQVYEEFRGVLTASATGPLTDDAYAALGVRQSIFNALERPRVYALFMRYRAWLTEQGFFDVNLTSHALSALAQPRFDCVAVDEVQDLTPVQLALILKTLKSTGQFLLCGDSNQIVHPNFFSWSAVKSLFWRGEGVAERQPLHLLRSNYRNATQVTALANTLLKIKHARFGSIDRESNFLIEATDAQPGEVHLVPDTADSVRTLDVSARQSSHIAVLVLREEDKKAARERFKTPLLFAIHEAKGLEYETIVLYRFVSGHREEYQEITSGVTGQALEADELTYARARDKGDKSLEVYKFFINALYVALTRAVKALYWVESDTTHALFPLLGLSPAGAVHVEARRSSAEEWQQEAQKLDLQGKQEQAAAIRRDVLNMTSPRWPVFDEATVRALVKRVFCEPGAGEKARRQLADYGAFYEEPELLHWLKRQRQESEAFVPYPLRAPAFMAENEAVKGRYLAPYCSMNFKEVLRECAAYGIEHRTMMNLTPLQAAALAGNVPLVRALRERGADRLATDHFGRTALHWALLSAFSYESFTLVPFPQLYELLAPPVLDVRVNGRLIRIDQQQSEYLLFHTIWALMKPTLTGFLGDGFYIGINAPLVHRVWKGFPPIVAAKERNQVKSISAVLSRNERARDYAYNRALFMRTAHGRYVVNPALHVKCQSGGREEWLPAFTALNLAFAGEFANPDDWLKINRLLEDARLPRCRRPTALERMPLVPYEYEDSHAPNSVETDDSAGLAGTGETAQY